MSHAQGHGEPEDALRQKGPRSASSGTRELVVQVVVTDPLGLMHRVGGTARRKTLPASSFVSSGPRTRNSPILQTLSGELAAEPEAVGFLQMRRG